MPDASKVSVGKPAVTGAIYYAVAGTALPTDASAALAAAFNELGYVSEDGLVNGGSLTRENFKAWGGDVVNSAITDKTDTFRFTLIESMNDAVQKFARGDSNVTGALATGLTVKVNSKDPGEHPMVVDMLLRSGGIKRITIPRAILSELGEIVYRDSDTIGYQCTVLALADTAGNTHYEYIKRASA